MVVEAMCQTSSMESGPPSEPQAVLCILCHCTGRFLKRWISGANTNPKGTNWDSILVGGGSEVFLHPIP